MKKTNKIAELNYKLSQIRVWSFLSFKEKWVKNNDFFYKKRVKQIETNLSISLHTELMSHFVDESKGKFDHDHTDINNSVQKTQQFTLERKGRCFRGVKF